MTTSTQQPIPHQVKYCPMLQKDCIEDKCAWYVNNNMANSKISKCAMSAIASNLSGLLKKPNINN